MAARSTRQPLSRCGESALGDTLVDESGLTLYVFTNDTPGASVCTEGCAEAWPPVIVPGEIVVGDGLDEALFTTIDRGNGEMQLAVDGRPLYRFSGDAATGDANGQGVGEVWFVAAPDGSGIEAACDRRREPGRPRLLIRRHSRRPPPAVGAAR